MRIHREARQARNWQMRESYVDSRKQLLWTKTTRVCYAIYLAMYRTVDGTSKCSNVTFSVMVLICCVLINNFCTVARLEMTRFPVKSPTSRTANAMRKDRPFFMLSCKTLERWSMMVKSLIPGASNTCRMYWPKAGNTSRARQWGYPCHFSGGNNLTETGLITTTAISSGSTSASTIYSTTARTSVAYRIVGYVESTQATAGTWATAPSTIQGYGGQALNAMSSLGYGQNWTDVTASRALSTVYYNTTGKPMGISIEGTAANLYYATYLYINNVLIGYSLQPAAYWPRIPIFGIIPANGNYQVTGNGFYTWCELS